MKKAFKIVFIICLIYLFLIVNNEWLKITSYEYTSEKIPGAFDGYKIVQVTDLHDAELGENHSRLIKKVASTEPDIILVTGDVIDSRRYDLEKSLRAMEQLVEIAPVYYVLGNHEVATNEMGRIYEALELIGVHTLKNEHVLVELNGEKIAFVGIEDPLMGMSPQKMMQAATSGLDSSTFTALLSHRPEKFNDYVEQSLDLVFTGHAHGGQIRLPFIGGLIAPSQGWFPKYTDGLFEDGETTMLVNRGIGNSLFPFRIFNRPEIIEMKLNAQ
jgi:uncharacterized protein